MAQPYSPNSSTTATHRQEQASEVAAHKKQIFHKRLMDGLSPTKQRRANRKGVLQQEDYYERLFQWTRRPAQSVSHHPAT